LILSIKIIPFIFGYKKDTHEMDAFAGSIFIDNKNLIYRSSVLFHLKI